MPGLSASNGIHRTVAERERGPRRRHGRVAFREDNREPSPYCNIKVQDSARQSSRNIPCGSERLQSGIRETMIRVLRTSLEATRCGSHRGPDTRPPWQQLSLFKLDVSSR